MRVLQTGLRRKSQGNYKNFVFKCVAHSHKDTRFLQTRPHLNTIKVCHLLPTVMLSRE